MKRKPILILIAGVGGSGKSTAATKIAEHIWKKEKNEESTIILRTDHLTSADLKNSPLPYIKDGVTDFIEKYEYLTNVLSFDEDLMLDKIGEITDEGQVKVIVIEGVMSLSFEKVRSFADLKIYIDTDNDISLIRRIQRSDYYKKIVGEVVDEDKQQNFGSSLKEAFDLWIIRKKAKSLDHRYNRDIRDKKRYADLTLTNNYQEDFERNFKKIITLIDLYFESEEKFENLLKRKSGKLEENIPDLEEKVVDKFQEEKKIWEAEKKNLNQQIQKLQFQIDQQRQEQIARIEEITKKN